MVQRVIIISGGIVAMLLVGCAAPVAQTGPAIAKGEDPIEMRERIIKSNLAVVKAVPSDAETLTAEQTAAVEVLAKFRAEEAAPELVRIITARSPVTFHPIPSGSTFGGQDKHGGDYVAAEALKEIGRRGMFAILDDIKAAKAVPDNRRLEVYANTFMGLFPGSLGLEYLRQYQRAAPPNRKGLYDPLIRTMEKQLTEVVRPIIYFEEAEEGDLVFP